MERDKFISKLGGVVDYEHFESYKERFKQFFAMKRENGILEVRMHVNDGEAGWCYGIHNGWSKLVKAIAQDQENEVLIITGTGDHWIGPIRDDNAKAAFAAMAEDPVGYARTMYDDWYVDGQDLMVCFINDIHIPTIAAINGPGPGHTEFALVCDLAICADDTTFVEPHFNAGPGFVPGDGQLLTFQHLLGTRRANYLALTGKEVDAQRALEWGLVNEIMPRDQLMNRAWELARMLMAKDRMVRRLTHDILRQPWKHAIESELKFSHQFAMECWSAGLSTVDNIKKATQTLMKDGMAEKEKNREQNIIK